jgi:hypothetical protein
MLTKFTKSLTTVTLAGVLFTAASASQAGIILVQPENFSGTGLGSVNTILTIQGKNNGTVEMGAVSFNGTADVITGADTKTGNSQTQTRTLGSLGITDASSLRIVFNAVESDNLINLTGLTLNIYSATGATLFTTSLNQMYNNMSTQSGTGNSGFVFGLDGGSASAAQQAVFTLPNFMNARIGLSASATSYNGGNETFFVANSLTQGPGVPASGQVPEPASVLLVGLGLAAAAISRRKKA